jgi:hypothetical protein
MKAPLVSTLSLTAASAYFVVLFLPWDKGPLQFSGWSLGSASGLVALGLVLVELLRRRGAWASRGYELVGFVLTGGAALLGGEGLANLATNVTGFRGSPPGFSNFGYGAWAGLGLVAVLLLLAVARFLALRPSQP